jgi:hypothetical protein
VSVIRDVDWLDSARRFPGELRLPYAATIVRVQSRAERCDRCRFETRCYISSRRSRRRPRKRPFAVQRKRVLDVVFADDQSRLRKGPGAKSKAVGMQKHAFWKNRSSDFAGALGGIAASVSLAGSLHQCRARREGQSPVIGDADIGAGTISCNYDDFLKYRTTIGETAFIGSNSSLVAPVTIGQGANVGSGFVITKDVAPDALVVARGRQMEKVGWVLSFVWRRRQKRPKNDNVTPLSMRTII